ncbi:MAG: bifunctional phosphopantothenoylcysteine decarboxylase/phosphopantothenate--cysteine ligase CoaBC [Balneolaceae bacterium]
MRLDGKKILLGVTGGIAAYKSVLLLRELQKKGADIRVAMTPSATRFVGTETFTSLTHHEVAVEIFSGNRADESWTRHIHLGEWADLFLIAPCTANTLAKLAHGHSDNLLTSIALAARCPLLICPTMDGEMNNHPAVVHNKELLERYGFHLMEPEEGYLASGLQGRGRLPDPGTIIEKVEELLLPPKGSLSGKKVLVTAGPTREYLDPVRFLSNPSSGKMGCAMAEAARNTGAIVTLLRGPGTVPAPRGVTSESFVSTADLFEQVKAHADADVVIMAAAVSDFRPRSRAVQKIKKKNSLTAIEMDPNPDILSWLGFQKREDQVLIGFAMETENLLENAGKKLQEKRVNYIVANELNSKETGFDSDYNRIFLIGGEKPVEMSGTKKEISERLLKQIFG